MVENEFKTVTLNDTSYSNCPSCGHRQRDLLEFYPKQIRCEFCKIRYTEFVSKISKMMGEEEEMT